MALTVPVLIEAKGYDEADVAVDALLLDMPQVPRIFCQFFVPDAFRVAPSFALVKLSTNAFSFVRAA